MRFNPEIHHRHALRLRGHDYTQPGAYFVTVCTWGRESVLGDVVDREMRSNEVGELVQRTWETLPERFPGIVLDALVVMPNHVHGIVMIGDKPGESSGIGHAGRVGDGDEVGRAGVREEQGHSVAGGQTGGGNALDGRGQSRGSEKDRDGSGWDRESGGSEERGEGSERGGFETGGQGEIGIGEKGGPEKGGASPAPTRVALASQQGDCQPISAPRHSVVPGHLVGAGLAPPVSRAPVSRVSPSRQATLGEIVGAFKSLSAIGCNRLLGRSGQPFWQRGFHDHIVRNDGALERIRWYIAGNPAHWDTDEENPIVAPNATMTAKATMMSKGDA